MDSKHMNYQTLDKKAIIKGLDNLGNTCYMNSSIQALHAIPELRQHISQINCNKPLHLSFKKLFHELDSMTDETSVDPTNFWQTFAEFNSEFQDKEQHDAQEFLRYLINGLHDEINTVQAKPKTQTDKQINSNKAWDYYNKYVDNSYLVDLFVGQFKSTVRCDYCKHESCCYETFWDLSISIPEVDHQITIVECLRYYFTDEQLTGDSMPTCDTCAARRSSTKLLAFRRTPKILVIQLKRFLNDGKKISRLVTIETQITIDGLDYSIFALITHKGHTCLKGHYVCYCKVDDQWYTYDDEEIHKKFEMHWDDIPGSYILFYRQIPGPSHPI
ncbi:ubiquitin carboxyl-terminal hydrolase 2-like [Oppia nitens]|uniref:ubiquitin carboxyl-terminal hydrolase 2-like n=1 Tax=Oppia nitens TaxID=1686743 RepID=UPI0023DB07E4|nr:ubiquitin carboxyl-terminal hydrolase 2-like [Oppia nitens]